jgi:hypothetical protein
LARLVLVGEVVVLALHPDYTKLAHPAVAPYDRVLLTVLEL